MILKRYFTIGFLSLSVLFFSCDTTETKSKKVIDVAVTSEPVDSLSLINNRIVEDASNKNLYHERALLYLKENKLEEASNDMNRSIKLDSLVSDFHITRGEIFLRQGNIAMAKISYDRAVAIDPKNVDGHSKMALYFLGLKDYSGALKSADDALRLDVNNPKTYFIKGRIFLAAGDTTRALSSFQTSTEMNSDYFEAYQLLALIYANRNDDLALNYYNSALEIKPDDIKALYGRGHFEMKQNEKVKAMKTFKKITRLNEADPIPYYNIAYLHMSDNEIDSSIVYYSMAINRSPDYYQAFYNRGLCYEFQENLSLSSKDYKEALKLKPDYALAIEALNRIDK